MQSVSTPPPPWDRGGVVGCWCSKRCTAAGGAHVQNDTCRPSCAFQMFGGLPHSRLTSVAFWGQRRQAGDGGGNWGLLTLLGLQIVARLPAAAHALSARCASRACGDRKARGREQKPVLHGKSPSFTRGSNSPVAPPPWGPGGSPDFKDQKNLTAPIRTSCCCCCCLVRLWRTRERAPGAPGQGGGGPGPELCLVALRSCLLPGNGPSSFQREEGCPPETLGTSKRLSQQDGHPRRMERNGGWE